jgi:hypothetical protein
MLMNGKIFARDNLFYLTAKYSRSSMTVKFVCLSLWCFLAFSSFSQQKVTDLDKSPLDESYFPPNYPILKMDGKVKEAPLARVIYSRPQKLGRQIFGGLVAYDQVWRLGANEATEIELFKTAKINGRTLPKGRYTLYAICADSVWTVIFNNEKDVWGLYYNPKKDVLRTEVPVQKTAEPVEAFTMYFENRGDGALLNILWDRVRVSVPISF